MEMEEVFVVVDREKEVQDKVVVWDQGKVEVGEHKEVCSPTRSSRGDGATEGGGVAEKASGGGVSG